MGRDVKSDSVKTISNLSSKRQILLRSTNFQICSFFMNSYDVWYKNPRRTFYFRFLAYPQISSYLRNQIFGILKNKYESRRACPPCLHPASASPLHPITATADTAFFAIDDRKAARLFPSPQIVHVSLAPSTPPSQEASPLFSWDS